MTKKEANYLEGKIQNEGFDYAILEYSSWKEIKDEKFHEILKKLHLSYDEMKSYLESQGVEIEN